MHSQNFGVPSYKEWKSHYNVFLILIFNEIFKLKTSDERQHWKTRRLLWTVRASTFNLHSDKDPFAFVTALPRSSEQKIRMKCYLILRKLHWIHKIFLKIILRTCKINLLMSFFLLSLTISPAREQNNKKHLFLRKLSSLDPILYINFLILSTFPDNCEKDGTYNCFPYLKKHR